MLANVLAAVVLLMSHGKEYWRAKLTSKQQQHQRESCHSPAVKSMLARLVVATDDDD